MKFLSKAREDFQIQPITSGEMDAFVRTCANVYRGKPYWLDGADHIDTINFAKAVCSETARLATLAIGIQIDGSARAEWLQEQVDKIYFQLRHWVEYGCAYGTVILKPSLDSVDLFTPDRFTVTDSRNGEVRGAVFYDQATSTDGQRYYTRLEYHRFLEDGTYAITNRCYVGYSPNDISRPVNISLTPWAGLAEDATIENVDRPLFGVFRTPQANNLDIDSPLGMPIFADALRELKDLDIAYSRNAKEVIDSKRTVLLDSDTMLPVDDSTILSTSRLEYQREKMGLPDYIKNVQGDGTATFYQEINPTLNTDTRLTGINALLSQIGYKCGFANGYFVFNETKGLATATQVEADQQRTIQFIKDVRDKLESAVKGLVYALNVFADLYDLAPVGSYNEDDMLHFADILYNFEEDRAHHYSLAMQGKYPWEEYYVKYLKCSREEAQTLLAMAKKEQAVPRLFGLDE